MNFYYDPILGLQYTYLGDLFLIDVDALPQVSEEVILKYIRQAGIYQNNPTIERILNITNYKI